MKKKFLPGTALFCIIIGFFNLLMWLVLILTGEVEGIRTQLVSFIFHWISEFAMASLLIVAGFKILWKHANARSYFFLAIGFMINAVQGAAWYYYLNPDFSILAVMLFILVAGIYFAVSNYRGLRDILIASFGTILYASLNFIGNSLQDHSYTYLIYTVPVFILAIILTPYLLKFKIRKLDKL